MPPPSALSRMALRYWLLSINYRSIKEDLSNITIKKRQQRDHEGKKYLNILTSDLATRFLKASYCLVMIIICAK